LETSQDEGPNQRAGDGRREWNAPATASCDLAFAPAELRGDAVRAAEKRELNREGQRAGQAGPQNKGFGFEAGASKITVLDLAMLSHEVLPFIC
jgi:hypothetical protein